MPRQRFQLAYPLLPDGILRAQGGVLHNGAPTAPPGVVLTREPAPSPTARAGVATSSRSHHGYSGSLAPGQALDRASVRGSCTLTPRDPLPEPSLASLIFV